ncbi:MAG: D-alanine--D-alanine ligase [Calditrichales bacterium]|nr:MAG: D-alanine--D-alanine ligase [Calditrichales bacterium]
MKVGLTYDLRQDYLDLGFSEEETAEFDRVDTIESIEETLQILGYETDRIGNIWNLTRRLSDGDRWDIVFNIAEGLYGISREGQVPALLEAYQIPYTFSDPLVLSLTLHKGMAKRIFRDVGIPTPDFSVIETEGDLEGISLPYPLFAKPLAEGTGKGIDARSRINNPDEMREVCSRLLATYQQPVLVETYLPGREFTVGIVGTAENARSVGIIEVILLDSAEQNAYSYVNKEKCEELVEYRKVADPEALKAEEIALAAWRSLGCRDGGRVDLRSDTNALPNIMEINPLAGIHPEHSDLPIICNHYNIPYTDLIGMIMDSALNRVNTEQKSVSVDQRPNFTMGNGAGDEKDQTADPVRRSKKVPGNHVA